jgi:hypothetical protein
MNFLKWVCETRSLETILTKTTSPLPCIQVTHGRGGTLLRADTLDHSLSLEKERIYLPRPPWDDANLEEHFPASLNGPGYHPFLNVIDAIVIDTVGLTVQVSLI